METNKLYDPWAQMLTECGRFRLYMFVASCVRNHSGYIPVSYQEAARALGLPLNDDTRHALELGMWSLHGDRRGEFRLIKVRDTNPRGYPLDRGCMVLLRVTPGKLRERGFVSFADMCDMERRGRWDRN